ncbi:MAG: hypothetical protein GYA57_18300 [Myxococcales bacterium]|nr:hypothetical protein [Myxococcales bacterium]
MAGRRSVPVLAAILVAGAGISCSGCPDSPGTNDTETEACTFASCEAQCRAAAMCYGSCSGGACHCMPCGSDADARLDGGFDEGDGDSGDGETLETFEDAPRDEGHDVAGCDYVVTGETRAGASPGVTCRRLSVDEVEEGLLSVAGFGDRIVFSGGDPGTPLWELRRSTGCLTLLDDARTPEGNWGVAHDPALEASRAAYAAEWRPSSDVKRCEIRMLDLESGERWGFASGESRTLGSQTCWINHVSLEYPWIVWRDVREHPLGAGPETVGLYNWDAVALNVETGEIINLSLEPITGRRVWGGVIRTDLDAGWAAFKAGWGGAGTGEPLTQEIVAVNLLTRERRQITDAPGLQYFATVTFPWIAWTDLRCCSPDCDYMSPCSNDIYGYNLETREEYALVVAGDTMQGDEVDGEGPWLLYEDQRGGADPTHDRDREEDIFAFHLPTRTEIRITDWPGYEMIPRVYRREDGSYGALFVHEISYLHAIYRLWDCDLPEPTAEAS